MRVKEFVKWVTHLEHPFSLKYEGRYMVVRKKGAILFKVLYDPLRFVFGFKHYFDADREIILENSDKCEFSCTLKFNRRNKSMNPELSYGTDIESNVVLFLLNLIVQRIESTGDVGYLYKDMELYLGSGASATVWKRSSSAIKVIGNERNVNYFMIEVRILEKLNHPCIVKIFSKGKHYGLPFYEMELGTTDLWSLRFGVIPNLESVAGDISRAVAYLHSQNVLHGDISPRNVLLFSNENGYSAKLTDFGTSVILKTRVWSSYAFTTKKFQPPNFKADRSCVFSFEYDVWSMGCVLFWVVNKKFFESDCDRKTSSFEGQDPPVIHPNHLSEATWKCFSLESSASIVHFLTGETYPEPSIDETKVMCLDKMLKEIYLESGTSGSDFF